MEKKIKKEFNVDEIKAEIYSIRQKYPEINMTEFTQIAKAKIAKHLTMAGFSTNMMAKVLKRGAKSQSSYSRKKAAQIIKTQQFLEQAKEKSTEAQY